MMFQLNNDDEKEIINLIESDNLVQLNSYDIYELEHQEQIITIELFPKNDTYDTERYIKRTKEIYKKIDKIIPYNTEYEISKNNKLCWIYIRR